MQFSGPPPRKHFLPHHRYEKQIRRPSRFAAIRSPKITHGAIRRRLRSASLGPIRLRTSAGRHGAVPAKHRLAGPSLPKTRISDVCVEIRQNGILVLKGRSGKNRVLLEVASELRRRVPPIVGRWTTESSSANTDAVGLPSETAVIFQHMVAGSLELPAMGSGIQRPIPGGNSRDWPMGRPRVPATAGSVP